MAPSCFDCCQCCNSGPVQNAPPINKTTPVTSQPPPYSAQPSAPGVYLQVGTTNAMNFDKA